MCDLLHTESIACCLAQYVGHKTLIREIGFSFNVCTLVPPHDKRKDAALLQFLFFNYYIFIELRKEFCDFIG